MPMLCPLPLSLQNLPIIKLENKITCDDKGLTAIFVFGLSGSDTADPRPCRSVMAALDSLKIVQKLEMGTWTAGVSAGFCFCGPVGNIKTRCEYVIMGGTWTTVFSCLCLDLSYD